VVKTITEVSALKSHRDSLKESIGFIPTMGNLHSGHISLLEAAFTEFQTVYFSIFVNPKQFGPNEDFAKYPRTLQSDLDLISRSVEKYPGKQVIVFAPKDPAEIFPSGQDLKISVTGLSTLLEGAIRPGHFDGVATVVYRLFDFVRPAKAYFGLKDYQQCLVIKQMVKDLTLPIEIKCLPIMRDSTGLALSSRNQYLSPEQKEQSLLLSRALREVISIIDGSRTNLTKAKKQMDDLKTDKNWNYLELRDADSLSENISNSQRLVLLGVYQLGATRLLDNLQVEVK
jgi:pantoate--beta-alanine ligase